MDEQYAAQELRERKQAAAATARKKLQRRNDDRAAQRQSPITSYVSQGEAITTQPRYNRSQRPLFIRNNPKDNPWYVETTHAPALGPSPLATNLTTLTPPHMTHTMVRTNTLP